MKRYPIHFDARGWSHTIADTDISLVIYFGAVEALIDSAVYTELKVLFPNADVLGSSTGTHILGTKISDVGAVGVAVSFASSSVRSIALDIESVDQSYRCGACIGQALLRPDLKAIFIICDGLVTDGAEIARGLSNVLPSNVSVSGA